MQNSCKFCLWLLYCCMIFLLRRCYVPPLAGLNNIIAEAIKKKKNHGRQNSTRIYSYLVWKSDQNKISIMNKKVGTKLDNRQIYMDKSTCFYKHTVVRVSRVPPKEWKMRQKEFVRWSCYMQYWRRVREVVEVKAGGGGGLQGAMGEEKRLGA